VEVPDSKELKKAYRVVSVLGFAFVFSVFIYAVIVEVLKSNTASFEGMVPGLDINTLRYVFLGVGAAMFFLAKVVRDLMLAAGVAEPTDEAGKAEALSEVAGFMKTLTGKTPTPEELVWKSRFQPHVQRLVSSSVVTFIFCNLIAVLGLTLFFMGWDSADFYVFFLFSLASFAVYFPRYSQWEEWVRRHYINLSGSTAP
jgi:hypothetical protein